MVLIKRQQSCPPKISTKSPWKSAVAYGDGRMSPKRLMLSDSISPESGITRTFFESPRPRQLPRWAYVVVCLIVACSWIGAYVMTQQARNGLTSGRYDLELQRTYDNHAYQTLQDAKFSLSTIQKKVEHLQHENTILTHEARMAREMKEAGDFGTYGVAQHGMVLGYMERRQISLQHNVYSLQAHIQNESRVAIVEKYGPGPHRVRFTVEFPSMQNKGVFVIEVASELMPHSSKLFLDQVSHRLWDNTAFWHHEGVDHLISAAAVSFKTGESRFHHFGALDVGRVSFAEYSEEMPHVPWTVGFAGKGPEFYINSVDNTKSHGPDGNTHQDNAVNEADPCFGRIVEGLSVVKQMYSLSQKQTKQADERKDWNDNELTHIISAQILTNN